MGRANHTLCNSASGYGRSWFFSTINANIAFKYINDVDFDPVDYGKIPDELMLEIHDL
jgi:hypothetical protein